ncbi:MAG: potassium-transporting ATPase subunit KdpC [Nitrospinae bacterium]|nr:potassium-transporting ATPase subunit KdpC [Nitrospinota bacterium]
MITQIRQGVITLAVFTIITGGIYPLVVTIMAQALFPAQANGSLIVINGTTAGSELIGQSFSGTGHFWSRPSATGPLPYNAAASSGSNLGPLNPDFATKVRERVDAIATTGPANIAVPVDLVTASGSGLDPHISPAAAAYQVPRVARELSLTESAIMKLVANNTERRQFGFLGEPRVNVLKLNLDIDNLNSGHKLEQR